ncbi:MAG: hypothetical protein ABR974_14380 [Bacteroidales bacterium]|jgi:hypothetical protein
MKNALRLSILILAVATGFNSCKHETPVKKVVKPSFSTYGSDSTGKAAEAGNNEILYGLITPTEISSIFSRLKVQYNEEILNPVSNRDLYTSNAKASINLGIYGVDFGYIKMFGIGQKMINYIQTVLEMSNKLGIPDRYLIEPIKKIESDMSSPDTIMALVNKSYKDIEDHLRKDGRESTAGLMLMGGWVEALYITSQLLYDPQHPDKQVIEKIAEQKYTLNSLLNFMRNYYDDPVVVYYTKKLIFLKRYFDTFDIYFKVGDLKIDFNRKVLKASGCDMTISKETLDNICAYAKKLRTEMITP